VSRAWSPGAAAFALGWQHPVVAQATGAARAAPLQPLMHLLAEQRKQHLRPIGLRRALAHCAPALDNARNF